MFLLFSGVQGDSDGPVIFAHQSKWQQHIMQLYGRDMILVDSTYNTTVYSLPLFVVCVMTNVGYVSVASFLLSDEREESVATALKLLCEWNPQWHPTHVMTDFHDGQINGVRSIFPGTVVYMFTVTYGLSYGCVIYALLLNISLNFYILCSALIEHQLFCLTT